MVYKLSQPHALPGSSTLLAILLIIFNYTVFKSIPNKGRPYCTKRNEDNCAMTQV